MFVGLIQMPYNLRSTPARQARQQRQAALSLILAQYDPADSIAIIRAFDSVFTVRFCRDCLRFVRH